MDKLVAYEQMTQTLLKEKAEAISAQIRLQRELEEVRRLKAGVELENCNLIEERKLNLQRIEMLEGKLADQLKRPDQIEAPLADKDKEATEQL